MKNATSHTGKLEIIERLANSTNGNPRYLLRIDGITCRTTVDSGYGYSVPNIDGETVKAMIGTHYGVVSLDSIEKVHEQ